MPHMEVMRALVQRSSQPFLTALPCWQRRVSEITEQAVAAEAASGKAYLHTARDINNRPVLVIRVQKHVTGELLWIQRFRILV